MSWFRRVMGLDAFDLALHATITCVVLFWIAAANSHQDAVIMGSATVVASLVVLGVRRQLALRKAEREALPRELEAERIAELEQRVAELEDDRRIIAELEERLDFTERLLAKAKEPVRELAP